MEKNEYLEKVREVIKTTSCLPKDQWTSAINKLRDEVLNYDQDNANNIDNFINILVAMIKNADDLNIKGDELEFLLLACETISKWRIDDINNAIEAIEAIKKRKN